MPLNYVKKTKQTKKHPHQKQFLWFRERFFCFVKFVMTKCVRLKVRVRVRIGLGLSWGWGYGLGQDSTALENLTKKNNKAHGKSTQ